MDRNSRAKAVVLANCNPIWEQFLAENPLVLSPDEAARAQLTGTIVRDLVGPYGSPAEYEPLRYRCGLIHDLPSTLGNVLAEFVIEVYPVGNPRELADVFHGLDICVNGFILHSLQAETLFCGPLVEKKAGRCFVVDLTDIIAAPQACLFPCDAAIYIGYDLAPGAVRQITERSVTHPWGDILSLGARLAGRSFRVLQAVAHEPVQSGPRSIGGAYEFELRLQGRVSALVLVLPELPESDWPARARLHFKYMVKGVCTRVVWKKFAVDDRARVELSDTWEESLPTSSLLGPIVLRVTSPQCRKEFLRLHYSAQCWNVVAYRSLPPEELAKRDTVLSRSLECRLAVL